MAKKRNLKKLYSRQLYLDVKALLILVSIVFTSGYYISCGKGNQNRGVNNVYRRQHSFPMSSSLVKYGDKIYTKSPGDWERSPIVLPAYRLVIFTSAKVGCTVLKMLARRMSGYVTPKTTSRFMLNLVHNPEQNGLTYLYHLNIHAANEVMTSPNWTRAIFVRDPKARFLSAYLDKARSIPGFLNHVCCPTKKDCEKPALPTLTTFFRLASKCMNDHWVPQTQKMEAKYWKYINFIGHIENAQHDAEILLRKVGMGAWEEFGKTGWGAERNAPIFSDNNKNATGTHHATKAYMKLLEFYTPEVESLVEQFYAGDYNNPVLHLEKSKIFV